MKCDCGENYVGETSRPWRLRIGEHVNSMKKLDDKSAWSDHIKEKHGGQNVDFSLKMLGTEMHTGRRKILEAIFIQEIVPTINRKNEMDDALQFIGGK